MEKKDYQKLQQGFDPGQIFSKGMALEEVDLIQGGSFREVIGRTVIAALMGLKDKEGRFPFSGVTIVLPPATVTKWSIESVLTVMVSRIEELRGSTPSHKESKYLAQTIKVVHSATLEISDLTETIINEAHERFIVIAEANRYKDSNITLTPAFGILAVRLSEDIWTSHVTSLCCQCVSILKGSNGYALIHVNDNPATRPENKAQLCGVENCYVIELRYEDDVEEIVNLRAQSWLSMIHSGNLDKVIKEIEELTLSETDYLDVLVQLFYRAGEYRQMIDIIEKSRSKLSSLTSTQLVKFSMRAFKAGNEDLANELLPENVDGISEELWLEEGLELALLLGDNSKIENFDARISLLFPNSLRLRESRDRRLLLNCKTTNLNFDSIFTTKGFTDKHLEILKALSNPEPDYNEIINQTRDWDEDWLELAKISCAMHARSVGQSRIATDIASSVASSDLYGRQATQIVLSSVRNMMLKQEIRQEDRDYYRFPLLESIRYLANYPMDSATRNNLSTLLSVESCGDIGIPIIALTMLDIVDEGINLIANSPDDSVEVGGNAEDVDETFIQDVLKEGLSWLNDQQAVEFGVTTLPAELLKSKADLIIRYTSRIVLQLTAQVGEDVDLIALERIVILLCAMCPHAEKENNEDLRVMRILAGHFATSGDFQRARNLAEQILMMGQKNAGRKRLAWLAFADIYHRCHNHLDALIGLACAFATDAPIEKEDLWQEIYLAIRTLRDLGLLELARGFFPALKRIMSELGLNPLTDSRIVHAELSLRLLEISDTDHEEIRELIEELSIACEKSLNNKSELFPLALLFAQVIRIADRALVPVDKEKLNLLKHVLNLIGEKTSQIVQTLSASTPSAFSIVALYNQVQRASIAEDAAGDHKLVKFAARRLLDNHPHHTSSVVDQALATEILADQAISLPNPPPLLDIEWPLRYAVSLNGVGLDVVFLALDSAGELNVMHVSGGEAKNINQRLHNKTFSHRMLTWLEDYPRKYGALDQSVENNEFYTSMEYLDIALPTPASMVIVSEPLLQQLTPNLALFTPDGHEWPEFIGTKTAIGMVPSLTWLSIIRSSLRSNNPSIYKAWISIQASQEDRKVLDIAYERLNETFKAFNFSVDTGQRLPQDISDAGLAVITAHGVLTSEGRYIHSIKDDGNLIEAPSALVSSLAGIDVVILFVCSGGRLDKHPWDNRTVGLPRQLLDNGSRVVIASPWPLNMMVTYRWLEPFMREWESGSTVLNATKIANTEVAHKLGTNPQYSLAMTVYGDVLLTKAGI